MDNVLEVVLALIALGVSAIAVWKMRENNKQTTLKIEADKLKIETDAATVKLEIEAAAAKLKLETEAATALALAETERQREAERARDDLALAKFRAEQDTKLADQAKELEIYRTERAKIATEAATVAAQQAQSIALAAAVQAEVVKELATLSSTQRQTTSAIGRSEKRIIASGEDVKTRLMNFFIDLVEMMLEDPPALAERLDRYMEAVERGDMAKAQDIKDEVPGDAPLATVSASGQISEAPELPKAAGL